jgi:hypothetical protein
LTKILQRQYSKKEIFRIYGTTNIEKIEKIQELSIHERSKIKLIHGHCHFGVHKMLPQLSTYITMLRNPVKRVISHYYFAKKTPYHYLYEIIEQKKMSLEDYITSQITCELDNEQVRLISGNVHVAYGHCTEEMLEVAKNNLKKYFSVVGTLEHFDKTLIALQSELGYKNIFYVKQNVNISNSDLDINKKTIQLIESNNQLDINLYNYALELQDALFCRHLVNDKLANFQRFNNLYGFYNMYVNSLKSNIKPFFKGKKTFR